MMNIRQNRKTFNTNARTSTIFSWLGSVFWMYSDKDKECNVKELQELLDEDKIKDIKDDENSVRVYWSVDTFKADMLLLKPNSMTFG